MKNIEVTDEVYDFLVDLSQKMKTQDNRATASPFMYIITEMVERPAAEGCGESKLIDEEGVEYDLDDVKKEYANEIRHYFDEMENMELEITNEMAEEFLMEELNAREVYYAIEREAPHKMRMNVFFTEDAVRLHLKQNAHHYNEGDDYVICGWRNPEMAKLHEFLKGITLKQNLGLVK